MMKGYQFLKKEEKKVESAHRVRVYISEKNYVLLLQKR